MYVNDKSPIKYYINNTGAVFAILSDNQIILRTGGHYRKVGQCECSIGRNFENAVEISARDALRILNDE